MSSNVKVPFPTAGKIANQSDGWRRDLWVPGSFDYDVWEDNFEGDTLKDEYPAAKTNGTGAAVTFAEHSANGFLLLDAGTDNDGYAGQGLGMQHTGDVGILFEAIIEIPTTLGNVKFEVGLSDADDDAGAVNVKATPTATATDYAVFVYDPDDDTALGFHSAKAGTIVATEGVQLETIAIDTKYLVAIRVDGDNIEAYWGEGGRVQRVAQHGNNAGIEGGNKLTPWIFVQNREVTTNHTLRIHKWRVTTPAY